MSSIPPGIDPTDPLASLPPALASIIEEALTEFIKANLPSIYIMIISSLWLGVSLCLFMALLWSSQAEKRRTPLFICCVIAVGFGTIPGILFLRLLIKSFTASISDTAHVLVEIKPYIFALSFFSFFSSFLVDSILLIRLIPLVKLPSAPSISLPSFTKSSSSSRCNFSSSSTIFAQSSTNRFVLFFGPLILIKLGRIAAIIALVINVIKKSKTLPPGDPVQLYLLVTTLKEPRAAWALQLADNALCSFLFVYLLKRAISKTLRKSTGYARRLRALFLIAASSFVFPVIFVIIELVFMTRKLSETTLASINISGTNVEIIGVLFATIWASSAQSENEVNSNKTPSTSGGSSGYSGYSGGVNGVNGRIRMPSRPRPLSSRVIDISVTRQTETIPTFTTGQTFRSSMTNTTASPIDRDYDVDHGHEAVILEMEEIEMERLKGLEEEREDRDSSSFEPKKGGRGVRSAIEEV